MRTTRTLITAGAVLAVTAFAAGSLTARSGQDHQLDAARLVAAEGAATGSSIDTCTLITEAEAADALAATVVAVPDPGQCTYVATDGTARALSIAAPDNFGHRKDFKLGVEQAANAFEGTYQEVSAGDEAYVIVSSMVSEGLARTGDSYVVIVLTNARGTAAEQTSQLTGLLQTALSRL